MDNKISKNIYYLLKKNAKTPQDLATHLGIEVEEIKSWMQENKKPEISKLLDISSYFDVTLEYLLSNETYEDLTKQEPTATVTQTTLQPSNIHPLVEKAEATVKNSDFTTFFALTEQNLTDAKDSKGKSLKDYVHEFKNFDFLILLNELKTQAVEQQKPIQTQKQAKQVAQPKQEQHQVAQPKQTYQQVSEPKQISGPQPFKYATGANILSLIVLFATMILYVMPILYFDMNLNGIVFDGYYSLSSFLSSDGLAFLMSLVFILILLSKFILTFVALLSPSKRYDQFGTFLKNFNIITPIVLLFISLYFYLNLYEDILFVFVAAIVLDFIFGIFMYDSTKTTIKGNLYSFNKPLNIVSAVLNAGLLVFLVVFFNQVAVYYETIVIIYILFLALLTFANILIQIFATGLSEKRTLIAINKIISISILIVNGIFLVLGLISMIFIQGDYEILFTSGVTLIANIPNIIIIFKQKKLTA